MGWMPPWHRQDREAASKAVDTPQTRMMKKAKLGKKARLSTIAAPQLQVVVTGAGRVCGSNQLLVMLTCNAAIPESKQATTASSVVQSVVVALLGPLAATMATEAGV